MTEEEAFAYRRRKNKEWREKHPEYMKEYREKNRERLKAYSR